MSLGIKYSLLLVVLLFSCSPLTHGELFNKQSQWFNQFHQSDKDIDEMVLVRLRGFGDRKRKQAEWDKDWRIKHPEWGPAALGVHISSPIPEIWFDIKEDDEGEIILPFHVLGHELGHELKNKVKYKLLNPDKYKDK